MAIGVSFHNREPLKANVQTLDKSGTTYLELRSGTEEVTFFINDETAMEDAVTILNAATKLVKLVAEAQAAKAVEVLADSVTL